MSEPYLGQIQLFGFNFAPRGWSFCQGQLLAISQYSALFSLLGTTFGGDGRTTFGLPDLRGRTPIGPGTGPGLSPRSWGQKVGSETNTLTIAQIPQHHHGLTGARGTLNATSSAPNSTDPTDRTMATGPNSYAGGAPATTIGMQENAITLNGNTDDTGGGTSVNNMQPSLGIYYCIATTGVYPSRT